MKILLLVFALSGFFLLSPCELEAIFKDIRVENIGDPIFEFDLHSEKYNRTTYVINGKMKILRGPDERMKYTTYINYYKGSVLLNKMEVNSDRPACDEVERDVFVWPELVRTGGLAPKCPIEVKEYEIKNFIVNSNAIPETVPQGQYEIEEHFFVDGELQQKLFILVQVINK